MFTNEYVLKDMVVVFNKVYITNHRLMGKEASFSHLVFQLTD